MNKLLIPGGSGRGLSFWLSWLVCTKRASLLEWWGRNGDPALVRTIGREGIDKADPATTGVLGHAILEEYYQRRWAPGDDLQFVIESEGVEVPLPGFGLERKEIWRVIPEYVKLCSVDEFEVLATELLIQDTSGAFGVPELTGRIDAVVRHQGGELKHSNGVFLQPGLYIVDHKFETQSSADLADKHQVQLQTYIDVYNRTRGDNEPVLGGIVNQIVRTKVPKVERALVLPGSDKQLEYIAETLRFCYARSLEPSCRNVTKCHNTGYFQPCEFRKPCLGV